MSGKNQKNRGTILMRMFYPDRREKSAYTIDYADLYRKLIHRSERLYSKHLLKIPRPHYIVFYNGSEKDMAEERRALRLSEMPLKQIPELVNMNGQPQ